MKRFWVGFGILILAAAVFTQTPPALSTADKTAIQVFEQRKQDAQKQFQEAQQGELAVVREWNAAHPGWHLNEQTFVPEPDAKPVKPGSAIDGSTDKNMPVKPAQEPKK